MEKSSLNMKLGRNLAGFRKALSLTQEQLALRLGVEPETISRFERGATLPSLVTLEKIAVLLHVRVADLLDEAPPTPGDAAMIIHAWIMRLNEHDQEFVLESMKKLCAHLHEKDNK